MARSVTRLGLPSRLNTNPNTVPSEEFVPGPTIPPAALAAAPTPASASPTVPQSLYVNGETGQVSTPYGLIAVHFTATNQNGAVSLTPSSISKNVIFTLPYSNTEGNATITGNATYTYGIQNGKIQPVLTNNQGSIFYQANASLFNKAQSQYNEGKQGIVATEQQLTAYQTALQKPNQSASYYQNYATAIRNLMTGEYHGYNTLNYYQAMEQQGSAGMQEYAPVKIATINASGTSLTNAKPTEYIYGTLSGKNQYLGALTLVPSISGGNVSFTAGAFQGATVQVSGNGWYGGIVTTFQNGNIIVNPKNYSSVTTNAYSVSSNGATYNYMAAAPTGFGIRQEFGKMSFGGGLISASNVVVQTNQGSIIEGYQNGAWYRTGGLASIITTGKDTKLTQSVNVNPATGAVSLTSPTGQAGSVGNYAIELNSNGQYSFASGKTSETSSTSGIVTTTSINPITGAVSSSRTGAYFDTFGSGAKSTMEKLGFSSSQLSSIPTGTKVLVVANKSGDLVSKFYSPQEKITYTTNTQTGMPTGEIVTGQNGSFISGSNFVNPVRLAGGNVKSATLSGGTLTLPMSQYLSYQNAQLASAVQAKENSNFQSVITNPTVDKVAGLIFPVFNSKGGAKLVSNIATSQYDPFYQAVQGGTLTGLGYQQQGQTEFINSEVMGIDYAIIAASGGMALAGATTVGAGEIAIGTSTAEVIGARALTGSAISIGLGEASSYANTGKLMSPGQTFLAAGLGASTGIILGGNGAPVGATLSETVGYTAGQVGKVTATFALFNVVTSGSVGALNPSLWNGQTSASTSKTQSSPQTKPQQVSIVQSMENSLYQIQNHPKLFLSFVGKSAVSGASFGSEYGGAFYAGGQIVGAGVKAISPGLADFASKSPFIAKAGLSAFNVGAVATYGAITREPLRVEAPELAVAAAFPFVLGGGAPSDTASNSEDNAVHLTATKNVVAYSVTSDSGTALLGTKYTPTSVDMLNYMQAEPAEYEPGLPSSSSIRTGEGYQVAFQGGHILYATSSEEGLAGASMEVGTALYGGDREYFANTFSARMPVYTQQEGQASTITAVGRTEADISAPKGTKTLFGYSINKITGLSFEFTGTSPAASTDALTQTPDTTYDVTTRLTVKNNFFDTFLSGSGTREVVVARNTVSVSGADITPMGDNGFIGRVLPREDGYTVVQGKSSSSFFGAGGKETTVGVPGISKGITMTEYDGYQFTESGDVVPTFYYETSDITGAAMALGVKSAIPPVSPTQIREPNPGPLKPFPTLSDTTSALTDNILPSATSGGEVQTNVAPATTIKPIIPTAPTTLSLSSIDMESPLAITGMDPLIAEHAYLPAEEYMTT